MTPFTVAFMPLLLLIRPELKQGVVIALKGFFWAVHFLPCVVPVLQQSHKEQAAISATSDAICEEEKGTKNMFELQLKAQL